MNHAALGLITEEGDIFLPPDVLEPLCQGKNNQLTCVYYPKKKFDDYKYASVKYDFMLTPIPERMWSRSARLIIHAHHRPGILKKITDFFKKQRVSVIHAEYSRSGHRYDTWFVHVVFEDLPKKLKYDHEKELYPETYERLKKLKKSLYRSCKKELLFIQGNAVDLNGPVHGFPNSALAYFSNQLDELDERHAEDFWWLYRPFQIKSTSEGHLSTGTSKFMDILKYEQDQDQLEIFPGFVFCEFDMRALNLRIAVIPKHLQKRFFEIGITYERFGNPDSCLGLINAVMSEFPSEYNVWRLHNSTDKNEISNEKGSLLFLIEDMDESGEGTSEVEYNNKADATRKRILEKGLGTKMKIRNVSISKVSPLKIAKRLARRTEQSKDYEWDVFLSAFEGDYEKAKEIKLALNEKKLSCFIAKDEIKAGAEYANEIRESLNASSELCVLCTKDSMNSTWVHTEWGAAWALGKRIVPIRFGIEQTDLPERLATKHTMEFSSLNQYVEQLHKRKELWLLERFESIYG